ncbi:MAG: AAA family ATPase [Fusobacteriota bacterium]
MEVEVINDKVSKYQGMIDLIKKEISKAVIGQEYMIDRILIGAFTGGHLLIEGVPGLAKSLTVNTISKVLNAEFKRIQFTPDLLPADILGTQIYHQKTGDFVTKKGPLFSNIILADEINRAPAKVQSALLEAMQEKQITIGDITYKLNSPFLVLATQNPLEQQGTYPLPEAQQDRFMLKLKVDYPSRKEEEDIINLLTENQDDNEIAKVLDKETIFEIRKLIKNIYVDDKIKKYVLDIIFKTREDSQYINCGASPRASINLIVAAKGRAFLEGRGYVTPDDIKDIAYDVLRHRILLTYEAEAEEINKEEMISRILEDVTSP